MRRPRSASDWETLVAVAITLALIGWALIWRSAFTSTVEAAFATVSAFLNWYYVAAVAAFLGAMLWLAVSRYHSVRLGDDGEMPEYAMGAWLSMLFAAGTGVGMLFWGVAEPIMHLQDNPFASDAPGEDQIVALRLAFFHWGLSGWAIYALIGLCLAFFAYRLKRPLTLRSALHPLLGDACDGIVGRAVDVIAVVATVFGVTTTLALGARQMATGLNEVFGIARTDTVELTVVAGIIAIATTSVVLGLKRGIRRLSEFNVLLTFALLLFFLIWGPTNRVLAITLETAGAYLQTLPRQSFFTAATGGDDWMSEWTIFFWGWWIAWAPFVGMFIARISRGRTLGEFFLGVFLFPTIFTFLWFGVLGGTALEMQATGQADIAAATEGEPARALFVTIREVGAPGGVATAVNGMVIFLVAVFFATSADSGTLVVNTILSDGESRPSVVRRVAWSVGIGALTAAMILAGDIEILQRSVVLAALPFTVVLFAMTAGLLAALARERQGVRAGRKQRRPEEPWSGEDRPD
ncbi:BCCT family transporter [Tranquillimonas alkanivorans]|uniref:Choline/glycine/proline betaine transport protein n=1 Tax=Tranquillimonas alkanivorans TaxID=441119 RepID=A0A1I5NCK5_9RHOB|nr:BCCT family transporter [Tranquillimonas alkanivorans]SFP19106.1 choline/glycine/proline betaine transport protein [Tranquillimonas alkanivorans]